LGKEEASLPRILWLYGVLLSFLFLGSANATVLTFTFAGNLTQVPLDEVFGDLAPGDGFVGSFSFDTSAADLIPADPATGSFAWSAPFGMNVDIGAHNFTTSGSLSIGVLNSLVDQYTILATSASGDLTLELFLQDSTGSAFSNDSLPSSLQLADFDQREFHLNGTFDSGQVQADGQVTTLTVPNAPEPSTAALALTGLILPFIWKRFQRTSL